MCRGLFRTQKTIFSTGTPVAAATVAPILATNTIPSATTAGKSAALPFLPGKEEGSIFTSQFQAENENWARKILLTFPKILGF